MGKIDFDMSNRIYFVSNIDSNLKL